MLLGYVKRQSSKAPPLDSKTEACFFIAAIVLIRLLFLLNLLTEWNNVVAAAADETGYFETAFDMLHGRFAGPWRFTVGTGLLYLPFLLTTGAESFYDIAIPFSYFSAFVLAPGALVLGFAILRRLGLSNLRAALPIACWAVWPFVHFHIENWDANFFQSYFMIRAISGQWWNFYSALINSGFNAMSDTPGVCAILGWHRVRAVHAGPEAVRPPAGAAVRFRLSAPDQLYPACPRRSPTSHFTASSRS